MSGVLSTIGSILFSPQRSIGGIIPDVVIRESGHDQLEITQHPIETGAAITDHAFKLPATLDLELGWAGSGLSSLSIAGLLSGDLPSIGLGSQRLSQIYQQMLTLQNNRQPITIVTGKRVYADMLLADVSQMTDATTENALAITARAQQIIIVTTQTTTVTPPSQQSVPASTAGSTDQGAKQPIPVDTSFLQNLGSWATSLFSG